MGCDEFQRPAPFGMMGTLLEYLHRQTRASAFVIGALFILLVGTVDSFIGSGISLTVFYLIAICLVAWQGSRKAGLTLSAFAALVWLAAEVVSEPAQQGSAILYWNALVRLGQFMLVTLIVVALRRSLDQEKELARTDFLTGAANARAFYETAQTEIDRARRYRHPLTIAYMDVDDFKQFNDQLGHSAGDRLLRVVAATIREGLRTVDVVARLGGDEFALLFPETDYEAGQVALGRMRRRLQELVERNGWPISFSIGAVTFAEPPVTVDELVKQADRLMYAVKESEKDNIRHELRGQLASAV